MAEQPPLSRIHVVGYSANDRDFPILNLVLDPRVAGYQVPKDLSACPDKRYPNHVFTGAQPISGDQRVRHVWEILPSPYVPFTRYDDDLGPVQGRRRSVKNEGQVASLNPETRTTYEAREGSAIVYTELEETWSIKTDEDGNSLFPIRDRDFYDPSRGPVQERRQLFVPTGEEEGSLENINGVITQTSYEPYNEFLSVKVVQTYKVDGPQLIGKATDNEGQLTTITTQRKAAEGYVPTSPTATRTIEVSREDAESLVERIVDTPQVFGAEIYRKTREDLTPQKFKAAQEDSTVEENVEGTADPSITLAIGEFAKSEQQVSKFIKRVSLTSRSTTVNPDPLVEKVLTNEGKIGTRTLTLAAGPQSFEPSATLIDANVEALGDGRTVKSETTIETIFDGKSITKTKIDLTPEKFKAAQQDTTVEENVTGTTDPNIDLGTGEFRKSEQQVTEFIKRTSTTSRVTEVNPDPITEIVITPQGQIATRTLRLSAQEQSIQPDALLVDGSIEALGDGRTVKSETVVEEVFDERNLTVAKGENIPAKFKAGLLTTTNQETIPQNQVTTPSLSGDDLEISQQRITEFRVKTTRISRPQTYSTIENKRLEEVWGISIPYYEYISDSVPDGDNIEVEGLGNGKYLVREYDPDLLDAKLSSFNVTIPTKINIDLPRVLESVDVDWEEKKNLGTSEFDSSGLRGSFSGLTQKDYGSVTSSLTLIPRFRISMKESWGRDLDATIRIFFLRQDQISTAQINSKTGASGTWPKFAPKSFSATAYGISESKTVALGISRSISFTSGGATGYQPTKQAQFDINQASIPVNLDIPACLTSGKNVQLGRTLSNNNSTITLNYPTVSTTNGETLVGPNITRTLSHSVVTTGTISIPSTSPTNIPNAGTYVINSSIEPYKFGWYLVRATVLNAANIG
jgi:hypothetical protein